MAKVKPLKRCPFCRGKAELLHTEAVASVLCKDCGAMSQIFFAVDGDAENKAVEAWNKRPGVLS